MNPSNTIYMQTSILHCVLLDKGMIQFQRLIIKKNYVDPSFLRI